ncbi:hypothetical protein MGLY_20630 [Neomoorella glycerini]|uniref:Uncharacterized protein n=1 Tax=Neomoorella glycerini TaxID=55779 RepID=A0A6I5ZSV7_9FIRM|nr:hypothetical protein MGLY_20630 [Moorella glycerini]
MIFIFERGLLEMTFIRQFAEKVRQRGSPLSIIRKKKLIYFLVLDKRLLSRTVAIWQSL